MKALALAAALTLAAAVGHAAEMKAAAKHVAKATVKNVDAKANTVTLDHEAVKSLNWPAMTMSFKVQDKSVMDKLPQGKKVEVELEQRGKDYVITGAR